MTSLSLFFYLIEFLLKFFPIIFLIYVFLLQLKKIDITKVIGTGILFNFSLVIIYAGFGALFQYQVWRLSSLSKFLLPPYQPIKYFFSYSWQHYIFEPVLRLVFALTVFIGAFILNKLLKERLFFEEELFLLLFSSASLIWPESLIYLFLLILLLFCFHILRAVFFNYNKEERINFYYLLVPVWFFVYFLYPYLPIPLFIKSLII